MVKCKLIKEKVDHRRDKKIGRWNTKRWIEIGIFININGKSKGEIHISYGNEATREIVRAFRIRTWTAWSRAVAAIVNSWAYSWTTIVNRRTWSTMIYFFYIKMSKTFIVDNYNKPKLFSNIVDNIDVHYDR